MRTIAVALQKGGVGKTTTAASVGAALAVGGQRVLLIDLDPQANLTALLGVDQTTLRHTVRDTLDDAEAVPLAATLIAVPLDAAHQLDLAPASLGLATAELTLAGRVGRELLLRAAITPLADRYDICLIDCPPTLGLFTLNAFGAADAVLAPVQAEVLAPQALGPLEQTIRLMRQLNPRLHLGGIVLTMVDRRRALTAQVESDVRAAYGDLVYTTTIPEAVKLAEAPAYGQTIGAYAPGSAAARAYAQLAEEVLHRG